MHLVHKTVDIHKMQYANFMIYACHKHATAQTNVHEHTTVHVAEHFVSSQFTVCMLTKTVHKLVCKDLEQVWGLVAFECQFSSNLPSSPGIVSKAYTADSRVGA